MGASESAGEGPKDEVRALEEGLERERARAEEYLNRMKYLQAEFENYIKRMEKERAGLMRKGKEELIMKLVPILDDLERALDAGRRDCCNKSLVEGVEMVLRSLREVMGSEGLSEIDALGKPFDPSLHEAVSKCETSDYPENTVVRELRRGYLLNGRVIRPSLVEVSVRRGGD
ncbi:MAG: nucleotide exchange factor GrpE [Candidatus Bathyarchaeia archaeon]